jgi:hypothetical protein
LLRVRRRRTNISARDLGPVGKNMTRWLRFNAEVVTVRSRMLMYRRSGSVGGYCSRCGYRPTKSRSAGTNRQCPLVKATQNFM